MAVRTSVNNPFSPGSDDVPKVWAGRRRQLSEFTAELRPRRLAGAYERGRLLLGEPGVGKSVLAGRIADQARAEGDWTTGQIRMPRQVDPFQLLAEALLDVAREHAPGLSRDRALRDLLDRVEQLGAAGVSVGLRAPSGRPAHRELHDLIVALAEAASRSGQLLLVHVDELQNVDSDEHASALLTALGDALAHAREVATPGGGLQRLSLPLAVYLTALPEFGDAATARRGATFARRFATTVLGPLDDDELREALDPLVAGTEVIDAEGRQVVVVLEPDAADAIVAHAHRDPFLFQLIGYRAWLDGDGARITTQDVAAGLDVARPEMHLHVDRQLDRLGNLQRAFIEAMVGLDADERHLTTIAAKLDRPAPQLGSTTQALEAKGVIVRGRPYRLLVPALEARLNGTLAALAT